MNPLLTVFKTISVKVRNFNLTDTCKVLLIWQVVFVVRFF